MDDKIKHIASMRPKNGQVLFKYDVNKKEVSCVVEGDYTFISSKKSLIMQKDFMYCVALNKKNAAKKFFKLIMNVATGL